MLASEVATNFDGKQHGSHGRRADRDETRRQFLEVIDLEHDQGLQEGVLTLYHQSTITFEMTPIVKSVVSNNGWFWVKNMPMEPLPEKIRLSV